MYLHAVNTHPNLPNNLLLIRSAGFGYNEQTSESNAFQQKLAINPETARQEFEAMVKTLRKLDVRLTIVDDSDLQRPDSIFPNNWIAQIPGGPLCVFPMMAENRQAEVREDIIERLLGSTTSTHLLDVRQMANPGEFLEGTGSMVFHHASRTAFACESPRTSISLFERFCAAIDYTPVSFAAYDAAGKPVYHTNVVMSIGQDCAVVCADAITDALEQPMVMEKLRQLGLQVVTINLQQMQHFCGNMLEVASTRGERFWLCSRQAHQEMTMGQLWELAENAEVIDIPVNTIEALGGGSVRCMIAGFWS
jgi:hypothetical protein